MRRAERIISGLVWTLSAVIILFTTENVWVEPLVRSRVRRHLPSFIPEQGSALWTTAFGAIGISCALLLVCLIFLIKTEGLKTAGTWGTVALTAAVMVLSVVWFRATGMEPPKPHSVTLRWKASTTADVQGYNVYRKALPNGAEGRLNSHLVHELTFTDGGVETGARYRYTVRAFNGYESADCTPVEVLIP